MNSDLHVLLPPLAKGQDPTREELDAGWRFVAEHHALIRKTCHALAPTPWPREEVADFVQDVCIRIARCHRRYDPSRAVQKWIWWQARCALSKRQERRSRDLARIVDERPLREGCAETVLTRLPCPRSNRAEDWATGRLALRGAPPRVAAAAAAVVLDLDDKATHRLIGIRPDRRALRALGG